MPKQGEKTFFGAIGEEGAISTLNKPFVGPNNGTLLAQIGAIMDLLPLPPGRLLDLGCGTGWTSVMLARRGYSVVGQDISEEAVALANKYQLSPAYQLGFVASDYEGMGYKDEFDCAVFFDSLHHAEDEVAALSSVRKALKSGGIVVISEPGKGHSSSDEARKAMAQYGVTERDMPPRTIIKAAKAAGFASWKTYPDIGLVEKSLYREAFSNKTANFLRLGPLRLLLANYLILNKSSFQGIVVLKK